MSFLDSLFSGITAFVREVVTVVTDAVKVILEEVDRSLFGKAATEMVKGATKRYFNTATDLAEEEQELAEKRRQDGRLREADLERLREIEKERERLRKEMDDSKAREATEKFRAAQDELVSASITDDESSALLGILSTKACPACGGVMRIRQGFLNSKTERTRFYWQCTSSRASACPTLMLDPQAEQASVIRRPDADLDGAREKRVETWNRPDVLAKTHGRLRATLGDADEEIVCPKHLLPMKLLPKALAGGRLLDSYEYVCMGVNVDGRACDHTVTMTSFPQVSAALRRRDGRGIIDGM